MGVAGHSIEDCGAFKTAVRKLIACGRLDIEEEKGPNIVNNPMPNHRGGSGVNVIEKEGALIKEVSGELKGGSKIRLAADQELLESWESDPIIDVVVSK